MGFRMSKSSIDMLAMLLPVLMAGVVEPASSGQKSCLYSNWVSDYWLLPTVALTAESAWKPSEAQCWM